MQRKRDPNRGKNQSPMLVTILLLGLLLAATATDVARRKVYNWNTYSGILLFLGFYGVGSLLVSSGATSSDVLCMLGWMPVSESLVGFGVCGFVMLVCFVLFRVGGGDVKLIAMIGAALGPEQGITAMLWTFVLGGCAGLIVLIWRVGLWRLVVRSLRQLFWSLRLGRWEPLTDQERAQLQPPLFLAPCALAAVIIVRFQLVGVLQ